MSYIEVNNISFSYAGDSRLILKDLNMNIEEGDFVCLLGQSGCGKSTLLRLLGGLEHPNSGNLICNGQEIKGAGLDRSIVFQDYGLFPWKSTGENIRLALRKKYPKKSKRELKEIVCKNLENVGLSRDIYNKYPKELSGGMQQRSAIARSFSIDAPILLMDEPFGALDAVTRAKLQNLLIELWGKDEKRKTVIFVTHDVDEALLLANKIFVLGQAPSKVIFSCEKELCNIENRESMLQDERISNLRSDLIHYINQDVLNRMD